MTIQSFSYDSSLIHMLMFSCGYSKMATKIKVIQHQQNVLKTNGPGCEINWDKRGQTE